jgi:hypothetical protein
LNVLDHKSDRFGKSLFLKNGIKWNKNSVIFQSDSTYLIIFRPSKNELNLKYILKESRINQKGLFGFVEENE